MNISCSLFIWLALCFFDSLPFNQVCSCGAWWLSGKFGALHQECSRFESHSRRQVGILDKSFTRSCLWCFGVLTLTQCQCCSHERLSVVVDLKRCYRNCLSEWMNDPMLPFFLLSNVHPSALSCCVANNRNSLLTLINLCWDYPGFSSICIGWYY